MRDPILDELAGTWEVMAEMEPDAKLGRRETLRECADAIRMLADMSRMAVRLGVPQAKSERETELEELLRSACAIAKRRGIDTAWDRFVASANSLGIGGVTARVYKVLPSDGAAMAAGGTLEMMRLSTLEDAVRSVVQKHGGVRAAGIATGVDKSFISRLMNGKKVSPSADTLRALGLRAVPLYEVVDAAMAAGEPTK